MLFKSNENDLASTQPPPVNEVGSTTVAKQEDAEQNLKAFFNVGGRSVSIDCELICEINKLMSNPSCDFYKKPIMSKYLKSIVCGSKKLKIFF